MNPFSRLFGKPPVIALLTDFGLLDPYVGVMKAVITSINPHALVVDITHAVEPQNVRHGGYLLWSAYRYFPHDTVFVAVVDPGVGSARRILGVRTPRGVFLAPDNMLLDFVLAEEPIMESVEVFQKGNPFTLAKVSSTFHGRDIFAPVAAHLSNGRKLTQVGRPVAIHRPDSPFVHVGKDQVSAGTVLHIDRFGNIVTNLRAESYEEASNAVRGLTIGGRRVYRWSETYAEAPEGTPCCILGSSGLVEISIRNDSAAKRLKAKLGNALTIRWRDDGDGSR